jgi:hypothetical protein
MIAASIATVARASGCSLRRGIQTACAESAHPAAIKGGRNAALSALAAFQSGSDLPPVFAYVVCNLHSCPEKALEGVHAVLWPDSAVVPQGSALLGAICNSGTICNGADTIDGRMVSVFLLGPSESHERITARAFYSATGGLPEMLSGDSTLSWNHLARKEAQDIAEQSLQGVLDARDRLEQPGAPPPVMLLHSPGKHDDVPSTIAAIETLLPRSPKMGCTLHGSRPGLMVNSRVLHSGVAGVVIGGGDVVMDLVPFSGALPVGPELLVTAVEHEKRSRQAPLEPSQASTGGTAEQHDGLLPGSAGWDSCAVISELNGQPVDRAIMEALGEAKHPLEVCLGVYPPPAPPASRTRSRADHHHRHNTSPAKDSDHHHLQQQQQQQRLDDDNLDDEDEEEDMLDWLISDRGQWIQRGRRAESADAEQAQASSKTSGEPAVSRGSYLYDVAPSATGVGACLVSGDAVSRASPLLPPLLAWPGPGSDMPYGPRVLVSAGAKAQAMAVRSISRVGTRLSARDLVRQGRSVMRSGAWEERVDQSWRATEEDVVGKDTMTAGFGEDGFSAASAQSRHRHSGQGIDDDADDVHSHWALGDMGASSGDPETAAAASVARALREAGVADASAARISSIMASQPPQCVLETECAEASIVVGSRVQLCAKSAQAAEQDREAALGAYQRAREAAGVPSPLPLAIEAAAVTHGRARSSARAGPEGVVMTVSTSRGALFWGPRDSDAAAVEARLGAVPMTGLVGHEHIMPIAGKRLPRDGFATAQSVHAAVCGVFRSRR